MRFEYKTPRKYKQMFVYPLVSLFRRIRPRAHNYSVLSINLYHLYNKFESSYNIPAADVFEVLTQNPSLLDPLLRGSFKQVRDFILHKKKKLSILEREKIFVAVFYDRLFLTNSMFRALYQTLKYPFENFDCAFMRFVFNKYPFLRDANHLNSVVNILQRGYTGYELVENGVKEVYNL